MTDLLTHLAFIGPGGPEILVVMLVLLLMFGAKDAPRIFRKLNEIINQIRTTAEGFKHEVMYSDFAANAADPDDIAVYEDVAVDDEAFAEQESDPVILSDEEGDAEKA